MPAFVGRAEPLARLTAAYQALSAPSGGARSPWAGLVLVTGEPGIGKTALLTRFASQVMNDRATVVWGTCWDGDQAPAWWPWTQALRALLDQNHDLAEAARPELAAILPELATDAPEIDPDAAARVHVFDAAGQSCAAAPRAARWWSSSTTCTGPISPPWTYCGSWPASRSRAR